MADVENGSAQENGDNVVKTEPKVEAAAEVNVAQPAADQATDEQEIKYADDETYKMYLSKKLSQKVAAKLMELCAALSLTNDDFDERAVELLASFTADEALFILNQLQDSKMYGVQNKPQYLMSVMKNFRDRVRELGASQAVQLPLIPGPDPANIKSIIDRTGYQLEVTVGQRKYHNPPKANSEQNSEAATAATEASGGCIYIGRIPKDTYEDALIPLFEEIGRIYDLRLMMDPINGKSRGYAFLIYYERAHANAAAKKYDGFEIQPGKPLKVNVSVANTRLFLGSIPKSKSKEEILEELKKHAEGVVDVIIYANIEPGDNRKNRGFCFVDFIDHKAASDAKRRISMGKVRPWNNDLVVDWAEQQEDPDEEVMATVKVLYLKNLTDGMTEEKLKEIFEPHGEIEKVKKLKNYAFVHFKEREKALAAMEQMNGKTVEDCDLDISLAKPQTDQKQKKKMGVKRGGPPMGAMGGRGRGAGPSYSGGYGDYYAAGPRGGGRNGGSYQKYPPAAPPYGGYAPAPYDAYAGYPPYYGAPYDPYAGYPDPYYGTGYGPGPSAGYSAGSRGAGKPGGRGGRGGGPGNTRGGRGRGGGMRGAKRPGGADGGITSKRGRMDDFSSDVAMNMF